MSLPDTCRRPKPGRCRRSGMVVVLFALFITVITGMCAFAIDVGYIATARTQLQSAVDAAAMAGTGVLATNPTLVDATVNAYIQENVVAGHAVDLGSVVTEQGDWDRATRTFTLDAVTPTSVRVLASLSNERMFFGPVFGNDTFDTHAEAVAMYIPRDVILVFDCSGSMAWDSQFRSIGSLSQSDIEDNLGDIHAELGSPTFGAMQWDPLTILDSDANIKTALGLDGEPYPYSVGSWESYIDYVQSDADVEAAGYKDGFGYLTLVHYWIAVDPSYSEKPDLWQTSLQPITAVKDGVQEFVDFVDGAGANDRLGLAIYSHSSSDGALLEQPLHSDTTLTLNKARQRQPDHYVGYTNIGGGMKVARDEFVNARADSLKLMVVMTDGMANEPGSDEEARDWALEQAQLAADEGIVILTISMGSGADTSLMQQIADTSQGRHFNVPGGQSVSEYREDLQQVFRDVAAHRPVELVH